MKRTALILLMILVLLSLLIPTVFGSQETAIELKYDDRKQLSELIGSTVSSVEISEQTVTSYVAGTTEKDANVLIYENGTLYAVGTGTAKLTVDGTTYTVTVSPAKLSLIMVTGHSIGAGEAGNATQSVVCEAGQTYSTTKGQLTSAEGGLGYGAPVRATTSLDAFAPGGGGTKGVDSGLAWQWHNLTGEKVWVMNLAISGSCLNEWQPGATGHNSTWSYPYDTATQTYSYAQQIIKNEIAAGHYTLGNMAIIYHNGANFTTSIYPGWTMESVEDHYDTMWSSYKEDLSMDVDGDGFAETVEALGMIPSWKPTLNSYAYDKPAGYYMSASAEYPDMFIASNATRDWLTEEGLKLFPTIEYTTQSKAVQIPESILHTDQGGTSDNSLFCSVDKAHLSQVTYNAVGIDAATNLHSFLRGEDAEATSVEFKSIDLSDVTSLDLVVNEKYQLIPLTNPIYGQNITFEASGSIGLEYPLQVKALTAGSGTVTAKVEGKTVASVTVQVTGSAHSHCSCGGKAVGVGDHSCEEIQNWLPWGQTDTTSLPIASGYYYLVEDMELSATSSIALGENVHLCLNGHTITGTARVYNIYGTLNLSDCSENQTGLISSSSTTNYGAVFYCYKDSLFNLYGGTLTTTGTNLAGGIGTIGNNTSDAGVMNIYGGKLTGGTVTHRGGNLYVISGSTLNVYGGTIENGTTQSTHSDTSYGGNIYISGSTVNVKGGTISGGTSGLLGGNIHFASGTLNISGGTVTAGTAANGGNIAISSGKTATVSGGTISGGTATTGNGGNFYTDGGTLNITGGTFTGGTGNRGGSIYITGGKLNMSGGTVSGGSATTAAGNIAGYSGATINISGGTVKDGNATTYGGNISMSGKSTLNISGTVTIQGGYTGTSGTSGNGGNIYSGYTSTTAYSTVNISGGTITGGKANEGGNMKIDGNGYITGGKIEGGSATSGGNIFRTGRSACELVISGGTITGGTATNGGNIYVSGYGKLTVNNGLITKGSATSSGGNIYGYFSASTSTTAQSIITIAGGIISEGYAKTTGGNIEIEGTGIITGGTITGGKSETGGNIYLDIKYKNKVVYSSITMSGGTIENGSATYGGNLQTMGNFTMNGGAIKNGSASYGGNIRVFRPSTFTLTDGTISGGTAKYNGGNIQVSGHELIAIYAQNATLNIEGGAIDGGEAKSHGGNIYITHFADVNISGGIIKNGTAVTTGGNIGMYPSTYATDAGEIVHRPSSLTMTRGTITGGNASRGGNIGVRYDASSLSTLVLSGTISDGVGGKGGNVYLANHVDATFDGAIVIGGTSSEAGDSIYVTRSITTAGTTNVTVKGDTVLGNNSTDLYLENADDTETCYVNLVFDKLSGKDKIIHVYSPKDGKFATADADYSNWLICSESGYKAVFDNGALSFVEDSTPKTIAVYQGSVLQAEYANFALAADVAGNDNYIKLQGDTDAEGFDVAGVLWVDLYGYDLSNLTVSGTLYGIDSTTDAYSDENAGTLFATVTETGTIETACKTSVALLGSVKRYLAIPGENNTYSFHRFYVGITKVTMKPSTIGVGYKAVFAGSDTVKNYMDSYGYSMWINEDNTVTRTLAAEKFVSLDEVTLRIDNFLDPNATNEENNLRANSKVNALVFIKLSSGEVIESNTVSYSFMDVAEMTSAAFSSYNDAQKAALIALGEQFNGLMFDWAVPNIHHQDDSWSAWTDPSSLPTSGKIYLDTDVSLSKSYTVATDNKLTICLNGHTIEGSSRIWNVYGTLNICDCCHKLEADKQGYVIGNSSYLAPVMYTYYGSVVNLYSGNITASKAVAQAGVIALGNDIVSSNTGTADTVFNMYGGHIYGGNATTKPGGNIAAWHGGSFNMYGGLISGGKAAGGGGNLYATSGTNDASPFIINLYGGTIEGGYSASSGGNIYSTAKTELHIHDNAVIKDGTATTGGNIYALSQSVTMDGGLVTGGKAENGGNLAFTTDIDVTLENATISNGSATACGGNIYILNIGSYTLKNINLVGGYAENDGGNLYIYRVMYGDDYLKNTTPVVTLNNTTVSSGTAKHLGGGIYNSEGDLTVTGNTKITDNYGSNLYLDAGQLVSLRNMTEDAVVSVTMGVAGKVSEDIAYASYIVSDTDDCTVSVTDSHIIMKPTNAVNVPALNAYSVGWYRGIVSSPFPVPLDGMGKNVERMETYKILTELETSLVVIADEDGLENAVVMCTMDTIVIPEEFSNAIAAVISDATGIPADHIFVGGTHTHAAVSLDENHASTREYLQWLYPLMAQYAVQAVEDLAPVSSTEMIRVNADGMARVRRYVDADGNAYSTVDGNVPSGTVMETQPDTELQAIRFARYKTTGKNDVILVNFQSHPGHDASSSNGNVSAEMWGTFRASVESQMSNTVCGFFIGAAGNQSRGNSTEYVSADGNTYNLNKKAEYGAALAAHLIKGFETPTQINTGDFDIKVTHYAYNVENWYKSNFTGDRSIPMNLHAVSIGDFAFITAPYEMFHENGEQLKDFVYDNDLFKLLFVITNTNGSNKYMASYGAFENDETDGKLTSFEVKSTRFNKGMAEALITAHGEMLAVLSGKYVEAPDFLEEAKNAK